MKVILIVVLFLLVACENNGAVTRQDIDKPLPKGWEFVTEKMVRKILKPSKAEKIVPDDFK